MDERTLYGFYDAPTVCRALHQSLRTVRERLSQVDSRFVRAADGAGRGRPRMLYHYAALPELAAWHATQEAVATAPEIPKSESRIPNSPRLIGSDDLAVARLRLRAVMDFDERLRAMPAEIAAACTCNRFASAPISETIEITERLDGNHTRNVSKTVGLTRFRPATLRKWHALYYRKEKNLLALAPSRKGRSGRTRTEIPAALLDFVWTLSASTARADVAKAVACAKPHWPAEDWPCVSLKTWQRRVREQDPRKAGKDLNHSVSRFRQKQSPDIEIDWCSLPYNGRWEIDDVQKDWYGLSADNVHTIRPFAYAIIRVSTRQWIAICTSEADITAEQVRCLVGCAMASEIGGIPAEIKFERGAVASEPHLESLLHDIGVRVSRTEMDRGSVFPGAVPDVAVGHAQGKSVMEANNRGTHNIEWQMLTQVGPEERHSAPRRTANILKLARDLAARGEYLIIPRPNEWHAICRETCERFNNQPHGSLPEILDPETGKKRHLSPNEYARTRQHEAVQRMDATCLPMFYARGERVAVTRNGFRMHDLWFGRFDDDLKTLESVTAYVNSDFPDVAYVHELGRCVDRYRKEQYGGSEQWEAKRHDEKRMRNRLEAARANAIEAMQGDGVLMVEAVHTMRNPTPERPSSVRAAPALAQRANAMAAAVEQARAIRRDRAANLAFDRAPSEGAAQVRRRSILDSNPERDRLLDSTLAEQPNNPTEEVAACSSPSVSFSSAS